MDNDRGAELISISLWAFARLPKDTEGGRKEVLPKRGLFREVLL